MTNFTKTVKLHLREPNRGKKERIEEAMEQSKKVANKASHRMPSIPNRYVKSPKARGSPLYKIVKDLRNDGIDLNSTCTYQAVDKARSSFLSQCMNGSFDNPPQFDHGFVSLHNRDNIGGIFENDGTYYVSLRLFPREKIVLPFAPGDYQNYFLDKIVNEEMNHGSGEIIKYDYGYSLNLSIKKPVDLDYEPETFIGVDLGLNVLAWAVALDEGGAFIDEIHFDGGEAGHIRSMYNDLRDSLQASGNKKKEKQIGNKESRWMDNKNRVVSRRIVDFAKQLEKPMIRLENINMNQLRKRTDNPNIHSWTAAKLRNLIQYKAEEAEVRTELVNPRNTSRECPKCGHTSGKNRDGIKFKCGECGYQNHADFVGAWNIA